jgi:hypothetical protein
LPDLVGEFAHSPDVRTVQTAAALDLLAHVARDLLAGLVRGFGVEHQYKFVMPVHSDARL